MDINSEEYRLWAEIVNDIIINCGEEAINIIEKVEKFCRLEAIVGPERSDRVYWLVI